jgi:hypothetical protein
MRFTSGSWDIRTPVLLALLFHQQQLLLVYCFQLSVLGINTFIGLQALTPINLSKYLNGVTLKLSLKTKQL